MTENLLIRWIIICLALAAAVASITMNWGPGGPLALGIDLSGGYTVSYTISPEALKAIKEKGGDPGKAVDEAIGIISSRIDGMGLREMTIRREGEERIIIQAPKLTESERNEIKERMLQLGKLEFPIGVGGEFHKSPNKPVTIAGREIGQTENFTFNEASADAQRDAEMAKEGTAYRNGMPYQLRHPDGRLLPIWWFPWTPSSVAQKQSITKNEARDAIVNARRGVEYDKTRVIGNWVYYDPRYWSTEDGSLPGFTGEMLDNVRRSTDRIGARAVSYDVDRDRQADFEDYTEEYINWPMAVLLNDELWSLPNIESALSESVIINGGSGGFTVEEQDHLVTALKSGSLKLRPREEGEYEIAASLGTDSVNRGVTAALIGIAMVVFFLLAYYRFGGLIANIALLLNLGFLVAILALFQATLTLPGIAGIILTIGMAVDANILIFERVREELAKGKTLVASLQAGYGRAFVTIVDANLTTFITAAILYQYGVGPIKGFAITLMTGIACSLFSAVFITRAIFGVMLKKEVIAKFSMARLLRADVHVAFMSKARMAALVSTICIVLSLAFFFSAGTSKYGLDFTGGTIVQANFAKSLSTGEVSDRIRAIKDQAGRIKYTEVSPIGLVASADKNDKTRFNSMEIHVQSHAEVNSELVTGIMQATLKTVLNDRLFEVRPATREKKGADWNLTFVLKGATETKTLSSELEKYHDDRGRRPLAALDFTAVGAIEDPDTGVITSTEFVLGIPDSALAGQEVGEDLAREFAAELDPKNKFSKLNFVGPNVVSGLKKAAIVAVILSLIAVVFYIWFRFKELKYGLAATVAVFHDVIIALGVVVLVNSLGIVHVPLNLYIIAGFLTIIGYSLNDTIVLFDRVRENLGNIKGSYGEIVNTSINHTLSRTVLTSLTTFAVVAVLFGMNYNLESPIEGIAFTLMIGVVVGTYSSIFIASPVLVWLHSREEKKLTASKG